MEKIDLENTIKENNFNDFEISLINLNKDDKKPNFLFSLLARWDMKSKSAKGKFLSFQRKHSFLFHISHKIFSSIFVAFLVYVLFFVLIRVSISDDVLLRGINGFDSFVVIHPHGSQEYTNLLNDRLHQLGLDGDIFTQVFRYIYYILPFKKQVFSTTTSAIDSLGHISFKSMNVHSFFGVLLNPSDNANKNLENLINTESLKTITLSIISTVIAYLVAAPLAILAASKRNKSVDKIITIFSVILQTAPPLIIIIIVIAFDNYVFKVPNTGISKYIAPLAFLSLSEMPIVYFATRSLIIKELSSNYVNYLSARGFSETEIFFKHILKNAIFKILKTIFSVFFFSLFSVSLFAEYTWGYEGLNSLFIRAIKENEIFLVYGYLICSVELVLFFYLINDLVLSSLEMKYNLK